MNYLRHTEDDDAYDAHGILRDGRSVRVPMTMRDSWRNDMHQHFSHLTDGVGRSGKFAFSRSGFRRLANDAAARQAKEEAYAEHQHYLENAWRGDIKDVRPRKTMRRDDFGREEKTWEEVEQGDANGRWHDAMTVDEARRLHDEVMRKVYDEHCRYLENAWKAGK